MIRQSAGRLIERTLKKNADERENEQGNRKDLLDLKFPS